MSETFDYIVVGAGSAGCVLAHRLIEQTTARVLLLEAGGSDNSLLVKMPAAVGKVIPVKTWDYMTAPHPATGNRSMSIAQGKLLGGSSSVNGMIYIRGHREDYDRWVDEYGCEGWGYDDLLPWFIESEGNESLSSSLHGTQGRLKVSENRYRHPLTQAFIRAGQEVGLPYVNDFNDNLHQGVGYYQTTTFRGERCSAAKAYLNPIKQSSRLTVITSAQVHRLLFDGDRAVGVAASIKGGEEVHYHANREVILSAGAIGSPRILMLSGIGHASHLNELGIDCLKSLPVGDNLQDHLHLSINATLKEPLSIYGEDRGLKALRHGGEWLLFRHGLMASNVLEAGAFLDTTGEGRFDTQIHFLPALDTWDDPHGIGKGKTHGFTLKVGHLQPASRGQVRLTAPSPDAPLKIDARYLEAPEDLEAQVRALNAGLAFLKDTSLAELADDIFSPPEATALLGQQASDRTAQVEEFIRQYCKTTYHPVGTCRMGTSPESSVVDTRLQVHGISGLRVIDCSVFPSLPRGNTNAPTIAVAEKAAAMMIAETREM
ncbi:GMC family oxidoreductase [Halomonas elongata]|uniref:GMC family oxidoreductase n=1 Tax=Halomonas elongata TaxID=2746 RepID=UPI004033271F